MSNSLENISQSEANISNVQSSHAVYESAYADLRGRTSAKDGSTTRGAATEASAPAWIEMENIYASNNARAVEKKESSTSASAEVSQSSIGDPASGSILSRGLASAALGGLYERGNSDSLGGSDLESVFGSFGDGWFPWNWNEPEKSPEAKQKAAIAELDGYSEGGMISASDRSSIRNIEHSIINGDLSALTNELKDIADNQPDRLPAFVSEVNKHLWESNAQMRLGLGDAGRVAVFDDRNPDSALVIDSMNGTASVHPWEARMGDLAVGSTPSTVTPNDFAKGMSEHATDSINHGPDRNLPPAPPERHSGFAYHFDDNPLGYDELNAQTQRDFAPKLDRASYEADIMREKGWDYFHSHEAEINETWASRYGMTKLDEAAQDAMDSATSDLLSDADREQLQRIQKAILSDDVMALRDGVMQFSGGDPGKMQALAQELTNNFRFADDRWALGVYNDQNGLTIGTVNVSPDGQIRELVTRFEPVPGSFDKMTESYEPVSTERANFELHRMSQLVVDDVGKQTFGYDYPYQVPIVHVNEPNPYPRDPAPTNRGTIVTRPGTISGVIPTFAPVAVTATPGFDPARRLED